MINAVHVVHLASDFHVSMDISQSPAEYVTRIYDKTVYIIPMQIIFSSHLSRSNSILFIVLAREVKDIRTFQLIWIS